MDMCCLGDAKHETELNLVDPASASTILASSRVRAALVGSTGSSEDLNASNVGSVIISIELPDEQQAVDMLLSTADLSLKADQLPPKEAFDIANFCNKLPLAISIAGQLVKDLALDASSDWDGILAVLKDDFADGSQQSVEETVIKTSLNSISGSQKEKITALFKCLALIPEDTAVPLDILAMIFQASCSTKEKPAPRPRIMMIRKWMKVLIERSLGTYYQLQFTHSLSGCHPPLSAISLCVCLGAVLGTVDNISLHDSKQNAIASTELALSTYLL